MRLLILGSAYHYSIENYYLKYLKEFGIDVDIFAIENLYAHYAQKNIATKILNKIGLNKSFFEQVNTQALAFVKQYKPSHILVFKGMQLYPQTIRWCKAQGIFMANYNPDHPFIFTDKGSGNQYITDAVPSYDLHFCYAKQVQQQIEQQYQIPTAFLPFGYEANVDLATCLAEDMSNEQSKVCFLGNPDKERTLFIKELLAAKIHIDVYGYYWEKYLPIQSPYIRLFPAVFKAAYWRVLKNYRVQLNILRKHNLLANSHNMRTFEIPAVAGIQLTQQTQEQQEFFKPNEEIFLFENSQECITKIEYLLSLPPEKANAIRKQLQATMQAGEHTYKSRTASLIADLKKYSKC
jgi:spore maturation protein CgeB